MILRKRYIVNHICIYNSHNILKKLIQRQLISYSYLSDELEEFFVGVRHGSRLEDVLALVFLGGGAGAGHEEVQDARLELPGHLPQEVTEGPAWGKEAVHTCLGIYYVISIIYYRSKCDLNSLIVSGKAG